MPNANPQEIRLYFQGILEPPWCTCVHCVYFSQLTLNSCNSLLNFFPSKSQYYTHPPKIPFPPTDVFGFAWVILLIANPWSWKYLLRRSLGSKYLLKFCVWKGIFALQKKNKGSNHLLRMRMEPKYYAEKVIEQHLNHSLTIWRLMPREN